MNPLVWLAGAVAAGVGAWLAGWPAWQSYRSRQARDTNVERYNAWRGRASRGPSMSEGLTGTERRRLWLAGGLAVGALLLLAAFMAGS